MNGPVKRPSLEPHGFPEDRRSYGIRHIIDMNAMWMVRYIRRGQIDKAGKQAEKVAKLAISYLKLTGRWPV